MLSSSRRIAVLVAAALLGGPARATLADPKPISAKDQKLASELVKKAIAMSQAGDHDAAIKLYKDAYLVAPNSLLLSNIGAQYQELGQWGEALGYFCRYLKEDPGGLNAAFARSQAKIVQRQLGRVGKDPCATPAAATPAAATPAAATPAAATPAAAPPPPRLNPESTEEEGGPDTVRPTPKPPVEDSGRVTTSGNPMLVYSGLSAGIAGIAAGGLGIYYGIQGKSISDAINSHPKNQPWGNDIQDKQSEGERDNRLQAGFLIASGVLVAAGVVLYVIGRPDTTEHVTDKTVRVTPTGNGVVVFGRF
jgi:tetratricopeptide (TPR) repeat protein